MYKNIINILRTILFCTSLMCSIVYASNEIPKLTEANKLLKNKQYDQCIEICNQILKEDSKHLKVYIIKGECLSSLHRHKEALDIYDTILKFKPNFPEVYVIKGNILNSLNRYEEALVAYEAAIKYKPDFAEALYNKALALHQLNRYEEEINAYEAAIKYKPDFATAHYNKGIALSRLNKYSEAVQAYEVAIKYKPDFVEAYNSKAAIFTELKQYSKALECYNIAIKYNSKSSLAHLGKGIVFYKLKKYDDALKMCNMALKLDPNNKTIIDYIKAMDKRKKDEIDPSALLLPINVLKKEGERINLLVKIPESFISIKPNRLDMMEFIPKSENKNNWSKIITCSMYIGSSLTSKKAIDFFKKNIDLKSKEFRVLEEKVIFNPLYEEGDIAMVYKYNNRHEVIRIKIFSGPTDSVIVQYTVLLDKNQKEEEALKIIKSWMENNIKTIIF